MYGRWSLPGSSSSRAPGISDVKRRALLNGTVVSSARCRTRAGTRTAGKNWSMSYSAIVIMNFATASRLRAWRCCRANQAR